MKFGCNCLIEINYCDLVGIHTFLYLSITFQTGIMIIKMVSLYQMVTFDTQQEFMGFALTLSNFFKKLHYLRMILLKSCEMNWSPM